MPESGDAACWRAKRAIGTAEIGGDRAGRKTGEDVPDAWLASTVGKERDGRPEAGCDVAVASACEREEAGGRKVNVKMESECESSWSAWVETRAAVGAIGSVQYTMQRRTEPPREMADRDAGIEY